MAEVGKHGEYSFDTNEFEETSLLGGWDSDRPARHVMAFEIQEVLRKRKISRFLFPSCSWARFIFALSVVINIVLAVKITNTSFNPLQIELRGRKRMKNVIYGHLHVPKTAGTEINGLMASTYDNVCGNKGYSLDYYEYNERIKASASSDARSIGTDSISNQTRDDEMNRGRVPFSIMKEIGFQDCDWISLEHSWNIWPNIIQDLGRKMSLELHVPCRDPVDHLMSMCHYKWYDFDCHSDDLEAEIDACMMGADKFSVQLENHPQISLKCFSVPPVEPYVAYMSQFLEARRIPVKYVHRETNGVDRRPRDDTIKRHECTGSSPRIAERIREILLEKYEYYRWCEDCLGLSDNDLFPE